MLIVGSDKQTLYQRSSPNPRITKLTGFPEPVEGAKNETGESDAWSSVVRKVRWDDSLFTMFVQPLTLSALGNAYQPAWTICGMVRTQRLSQEARHVPLSYLIAVFAPLVVLALGGPFLRVLLISVLPALGLLTV